MYSIKCHITSQKSEQNGEIQIIWSSDRVPFITSKGMLFGF